MTKIRCYSLQLNDIFRKCGYDYRVTSIDDHHIHYCGVNGKVKYVGNSDSYMGKRSREWVLLVGKFKKNLKGHRVKVTTLNGDFIGEFENYNLATRTLGMPKNSITKYLNGSLKNKKIYGYSFEKVL